MQYCSQNLMHISLKWSNQWHSQSHCLKMKYCKTMLFVCDFHNVFWFVNWGLPSINMLVKNPLGASCTSRCFFFFFFFFFNQKYIIQISVGGSGFERIEKYYQSCSPEPFFAQICPVLSHASSQPTLAVTAGCILSFSSFGWREGRWRMTFPPQKRFFFFWKQQPSRFQMVNALWKQAQSTHVYFPYFFVAE